MLFPHLSDVLEPDAGLLLPVDEGLVPHYADHVADHQGDHEVLVHAQPVALQRSGMDIIRRRGGLLMNGLTASVNIRCILVLLLVGT